MTTRPRMNKKSIIKWSLILLALVGFAALIWSLLVTPERVRAAMEFIRSWGIWAGVIYFLIYVCLASLSFPTTPLNVGAGVLFSYWLAALVASLSALTAAVAAYLIARYLAEGWVRRRIASVPHAETMLAMIEQENFKIVFLTRLNPFIPASIKNYGFALAHIPLKKYIPATFVGQLPIVLIHVYLGWAGGMAMVSRPENASNLQWVFIGIGAAVSLALIVIISVYAGKPLKRKQLSTPETPANP